MSNGIVSTPDFTSAASRSAVAFLLSRSDVERLLAPAVGVEHALHAPFRMPQVEHRHAVLAEEAGEVVAPVRRDRDRRERGRRLRSGVVARPVYARLLRPHARAAASTSRPSEDGSGTAAGPRSVEALNAPGANVNTRASSRLISTTA